MINGPLSMKQCNVKHLSIVFLLSLVIACGATALKWTTIIEHEHMGYAQIDLSIDNKLIVHHKTYQNDLIIRTYDLDGNEIFHAEHAVEKDSVTLWLDQHQAVMRPDDQTRQPYLLDFEEGVLWEANIFSDEHGEKDILSITPTEGASNYIAFSGDYVEQMNGQESNGAFLALVDRDGNNLWNKSFPGYSTSKIFKKNQRGWIAIFVTSNDTFVAIQLDNDYQESHTTIFSESGYMEAFLGKGVIIRKSTDEQYTTFLFNWDGEKTATFPYFVTAASNGMLFRLLDHSSVTRFDWNGNTLWQTAFTRPSTWADISGLSTEGIPYVAYTIDSITAVTTAGYRHSRATTLLTFNSDTGKKTTSHFPAANTVTTCPDQTYYCGNIISDEEGYVWPLDVESVEGAIISLDYFGGHLPYPVHKKVGLTRIN